MLRRAVEVESNSVLVATVALIVFIGIVHPDFLEWGQLKEVVQNATYVGIIAAGMAFLLSMRRSTCQSARCSGPRSCRPRCSSSTA